MRALTKKVKSKAGRSMAWSSSTTSGDVRSSCIDCMGRRWRRIVDNRMRDYGDMDFERHIIRINHAMHRRGTVPTPAAPRPMRVRAAGIIKKPLGERVTVRTGIKARYFLPVSASRSSGVSAA
jgi:hypothetical protein